VEDSQLKNLLVQLDERAARKAAKALHDSATQMRSVIDAFLRKHDEHLLRQTEAALEQQMYNHEEEADVLKQMIEAKRRQQGIIAPTEG
jgi:hypothetical protein